MGQFNVKFKNAWGQRCPLIIVHMLEFTWFQTIHEFFLMVLYGHHDSTLEYLCNKSEKGDSLWNFSYISQWMQLFHLRVYLFQVPSC